MRYYLIFLCLITFSACKENNKTSDAKKLIIELESKFDGVYSDADIDNLGNFKFDMGSASGGRVSGKLSEVFITMEILPERPGCADICPEMAVIHFKCINDKDCVTDPADPQMYGYFKEGVITFHNIDNGREVYTLLNDLKESL